MAVNKVIYGGNTLVDLTKDTVTPETLAEGETAHGANGERITGTMQYKTFYVAIQGENGVYTADKTLADIVEAYVNGRPIYAIASFTEGDFGVEGMVLPLLMYFEGEGVIFGAVADGTIWNVIYTADGIAVMPQPILSSTEWIDNPNAIYYAEDSGSTADGIWEATVDNITSLFDGLSVKYKVTVAGSSDGVTFNINGLGAKTVYMRGTTKLTTHFAVNTMITLIYNATNGAWYCTDYDANTKTSSGTSNKTGTKMYLVGGTSQSSSGVTTYTNSKVYIGTDNELYSNGKKVAHAEDIPTTLKNPNALTFTGAVTGTYDGSSAKTINIPVVETIPDYVVTEAEEVISRVLSAQGSRTFTFACINDMHYGNSSYTDGVQNAVKAMKYIDERIKLDAVMVLGDYVDSYPADALEDSIADFKAINKALTDLRFAPNIRTQGNHDYYENNAPINRRFIQAYSDNAVWGSKSGGYFYRDFDDFKIRVITINTTETGNANIGVSTAQYNWFINSLDLTSKSDVAEWQILVVSHHPLDWYVTDSTYRFGYILDAYKNGTSWSGGGVSCDYSGKNQAVLIGCIHGHIHNFLVDYIHKGNIVNGDKTNVLRLCNPEACIDRANHYGGEWSESTSYNKTKNSAKDTAFCIYCVDLDTYVINAVCYGAGYDRVVSYHITPGQPITVYENMLPKTINADGTLYNNSQGWKTGYRLNSSGVETAQSGIEVTGFIPCRYGDVITLKNITYDIGTSATYKDVQYWAVYDSSFTKKASNKSDSLTTLMNASSNKYVKVDSSNNLIMLTLNYETLSYVGAISDIYDLTQRIYVRFSAQEISNNSIIAINEYIDSTDGKCPLFFNRGKIEKTTGKLSGVFGTTYFWSNAIKVRDNINHILNYTPSTNLGISVCYYDAQGAFISYADSIVSGPSSSGSITIPRVEGADRFIIRLYTESCTGGTDSAAYEFARNLNEQFSVISVTK